MAFCADDCQTSCLFYFGGQLDVGASSGHIGGDGNGSGTSGKCHYLSFLLVEFGVEHLALYVAHVEHAFEQFGDFDRSGTYKHGASGIAQADYLLDYGGIFLFLGLVNAVVHILSRHGAVGGDGHHVEFIDIPKLASLGFGGTCHARKFVIHAEVVLQGDGGESLCGGFDLHTLLGLDGLVEPVAVAASFHDTACLFVDDFDFVVVDNVFIILFEKGVGFQELGNGVHTLRFDGIVGHGRILLLLAFGKVGNVFEV